MAQDEPIEPELLSGETEGYGVVWLKEVDSTNRFAASLAQRGRDRLWVVAEHQTAGRGSRGRDWDSISGNLFASLLLQTPSEPVHFHELTFVAALALRSAIDELSAGAVRTALKWPNDVLIDGKKCAGILLEGSETPAGPYVVVGIGVNCQNSPENTTWPATSLLEAGIKANREKVFDCLASWFARYLNRWDRGEGFAGLRAEWLEYAYGLGEAARVSLPGSADPLEGRFASIDPRGYMLLETAVGKTKTISAGDIFFVDKKQQG